MVYGDPHISMGLFYWLLFLIVLVVSAGVVWAIAKKLSVRWWEWLMVVFGAIGLIATAHFGVGTFIELAPYAFWPGMLVFGLPSLILLAVPIVFIWRNNTQSAS